MTKMTLSSVWVGLLPSAWVGPHTAATIAVAVALMVSPYWLHSMDCFVLQPPWILATTYWRVHSTPVAACTVCRIVIQGLASVWPWRKSGQRQQASSSPRCPGPPAVVSTLSPPLLRPTTQHQHHQLSLNTNKLHNVVSNKNRKHLEK